VNARFHAPDARSGVTIRLPADEGRHLARVLRLKAGDRVAVFDGRGTEFDGVVEHVLGDAVDVRVGASKAVPSEPRVALTLAQAVLKGDKMDDVVRDAVMMGVAAVQPITTARSEVSRATLERAHRRERWERIAVASTKQCGRAVVPPIFDVLDVAALPDAIAARRLPAPALLLVEPSAATTVPALRDLDVTPPREAMLVIGPEGGWTPAEIDTLGGSCRPIRIGSRTLRADAMATVAIAALFARWDEL
jgi:16S rRNA (uracil1498-N3)-methyltransferase